VTPETFLRWHRRRVARHWTHRPRRPGRPFTAVAVRRLTLAMAAENPTWGYRRIHGELTGLGYRVGASTVWQILKNHHIRPAPQRSSVTWSQFLKSQAAVACDFACVDSVTLRRFYLLFFIDIPTRRVLYAGSQPTRPASGPPRPHATCSSVTATHSPHARRWCATGAASSQMPSTRYSAPKASTS